MTPGTVHLPALTPGDLTGLWDVGEVGSVTPLGGGSINQAYRVQARAGAFHLRVYRDPRPDRVQRELDAIGVALRAGIQTPRPLAVRGGGVIATLNGSWASLFEVAPGQQIERAALTPEMAAGMGALLAELHARLPPEVAFEVPSLGHSTVQRTLERLERLEHVILSIPQPDEVDGWALARTRQRLNHLRRCPLPDYSPSFPRRFLHGDYHEGNLFFTGHRPVSIIDWEQCRLAPRAWEIVRCLSLSLKLKPELCRPFLDAYRAAFPLSAEELLDGANFYAQLQERNVWTYESVYLDGNPGPRQFIQPPPYVPFQMKWAESGVA